MANVSKRDKSVYTCLDAKINEYTLKHGLGSGGFGEVYFADVDLDKFDWATVAAHREKTTGEITSGMPVIREWYLEDIKRRIEELRKPELTGLVRRSVSQNPDLYPSKGVCAVKILDSLRLKGDRQEFIERFNAEWQNLIGIYHPNVITVYGGGNVELSGRNVWFYAMECLEGIVHEKFLIEKLAEKEQLKIVLKAAQGVERIHSHSLIHRDLKPGNILVTKTGKVKVTDLGIAKDTLREVSLTMSQETIGTPNYMSPEQARKSKDVDSRTDIYSLGAVFYEFLTGSAPFHGKYSDYLDVINALRKGELPYPITRQNPKASPRVINVVDKMMRQNRNLRYQSMSEVIEDIKALLQGGVTSVESGRIERQRVKGSMLKSEGQQNKKFYIGFGLTVACAALVFGGYSLLRDKPDKPVKIDKEIVVHKPTEHVEDDPEPKDSLNEFRDSMKEFSMLYQQVRGYPTPTNVERLKKKYSGIEAKLKELGEVIPGFDSDEFGRLESIAENYKRAEQLLKETRKLVDVSQDMRYADKIGKNKAEITKLVEGTEFVRAYDSVVQEVEGIDLERNLPTLIVNFDSQDDVMFLKNVLDADGAISDGNFNGGIKLDGICSFDFDGRVEDKDVKGHGVYNNRKLIIDGQEYGVKELNGRFAHIMVYKK